MEHERYILPLLTPLFGKRGARIVLGLAAIFLLVAALVAGAGVFTDRLASSAAPAQDATLLPSVVPPELQAATNITPSLSKAEPSRVSQDRPVDTPSGRRGIDPAPPPSTEPSQPVSIETSGACSPVISGSSVGGMDISC